MYDFALNIPAKYLSSDAYKKMFLINKCIVLDNLHRNDKAIKLLNSVDWSACEDSYKLCVSILRKDYKSAVKHMTSISKSKISEKDYSEWPIFTKFKKTSYFKSAFKKKFRKDFDFISNTQRKEITDKLEKVGKAHKAKMCL